MKALTNVYFILSVVSLLSCNRPKDLREYRTWFGNPENGFVKTHTWHDLDYNVYYRPSDLMAAYELDEEEKHTDKEVDSLIKSYDESYYFLLELSAKEGVNLEWNETENGEKGYEALIKELSFGMKDRISMVVNKDTLEPSLYHYERGFELGNHQRFLFAFPKDKEKEKESFQIIYNDEIFSSSILKFSFSDTNDFPDLRSSLD
ncbi:MAG: hypothetical protein K0R51_2577 [Cytophagaceae bacterium]|jgi:hypothetical protein|nr:hypothetical protein [Cytophagaceae bacterium]